MNTRIVFVGFALLFATPLLARDKTDVLVMKNGDRMTCEVKELDAGVLYVSFDYIDGTTSVDWSKVARVESTQLFVVKTEGGTVYTGTLETSEAAAGRPVTIRVMESPEKGALIDRSQIVKMVGTSNKFWERFNGAVSLGTIYSKGNQSTQYSLGSEAAYVRERWGAQASFDSNLSSSAGVNASTRNSLHLGAFHLLPPKNWFYSGLSDFLQSSEQGISLQSTLGGGIGRYFKNTNRMSVTIVAGAAWQSTAYHQSIVPLSQQNLAAALITAEAEFFRFSKTNLNATVDLLPALSDPGRVRVNTNESFYVKLFSDLKWNVSFYGNWDNRPPTGLSGSDYGTSSGLTWTFGLR
jgi:putative salt-induced outer membrane protein YdiY